MCGLFGAASTSLSVSELQAVRMLGIVSSLRGEDSTGFATSYKRRSDVYDFDVYKSVEPSSYSLNTRSAISHLNGADSVMGHCRSATIGTINRENTHPFKVGDLIGAHNGTIAGLGSGSKTDSETLYGVISEKGLEEGLLCAQRGAYALSWIDTSKKTLNFVRNKERQLWFCGVGHTVFWASEKEMLTLVLSRYNFAKNYKEPTLLPEDVLLTFDIGNPSKRTTTSVNQVKVTAPLAVLQKKETKRTSGKSYSYLGFKGSRYSTDFIAEALNKGCAMCGNVLALSDEAHWFDSEEFVCGNCKDDGFLREYLGGRSLYPGKFVSNN